MPSIEKRRQLTAAPSTRSGSSVSENVRLRSSKPARVSSALDCC